MPSAFEYHLDYLIIDAAAWDVVTLEDLESYMVRSARLPDNLRGSVEYLDLGEAVSLNVTPVGAMQLTPAYEGLIDRGIRGSVIYAPDDRIYEGARMLIATCAVIGGGLPDGYRLTRTPVPLQDLHCYLDGEHGMSRAMVA